jgi:hypothetical protein
MMAVSSAEYNNLVRQITYSIKREIEAIQLDPLFLTHDLNASHNSSLGHRNHFRNHRYRAAAVLHWFKVF